MVILRLERGPSQENGRTKEGKRDRFNAKINGNGKRRIEGTLKKRKKGRKIERKEGSLR